jgi:hypothetical protein
MEERDYLKNIPKIAQDFSLLDNIAVMALWICNLLLFLLKEFALDFEI